jgi:hypothetical protein
MSPTRTSRAAFAISPFDKIRFKSQFFLANVRVLKNRAAHNQASIRIPSMVSSYPPRLSDKRKRRLKLTGWGTRAQNIFALAPAKQRLTKEEFELTEIPTSNPNDWENLNPAPSSLEPL